MAGGVSRTVHRSVGVRKERYGQLKLRVSEYKAVVQKHKEFLPKPSSGLQINQVTTPRAVLYGSVYQV